MTSPHKAVSSSPPRELWVDNLRVLVVAGVIVVHTSTAYLIGIGDWYYDELTDSMLWSTVLAFPTLAGAMFGLGPLFLIAGWFSPRSLARRGPGGFARSRLLRLGVPLLVFVVVVQPLADYVGSRGGRDPRGFTHYIADTELSVMWFVAALLVLSLVYAALRRLRPGPDRHRRLHLGALLLGAGLTIAVASLVVWQLWPWNSEAFRSLRPGEWAQGAVLFALGVHAGETGWMDCLGPTVVRRLGWTAATSMAATIALFVLLVARDEVEPVLEQAAGLPTLVFAFLYGTVAVSLTLWLVAWLRHLWPRHGPLIGKAARASYATYVVHPLVLTLVMVLFAPVPVPPELKFLLVSVAGVAACFVAGYALTRAPGVSKVF